MYKLHALIKNTFFMLPAAYERVIPAKRISSILKDPLNNFSMFFTIFGCYTQQSFINGLFMDYKLTIKPKMPD
jgi:hypothetical protein